MTKHLGRTVELGGTANVEALDAVAGSYTLHVFKL
jgi:hypothetical protein